MVTKYIAFIFSFITGALLTIGSLPLFVQDIIMEIFQPLLLTALGYLYIWWDEKDLTGRITWGIAGGGLFVMPLLIKWTLDLHASYKAKRRRNGVIVPLDDDTNANEGKGNDSFGPVKPYKIAPILNDDLTMSGMSTEPRVQEANSTGNSDDIDEDDISVSTAASSIGDSDYNSNESDSSSSSSTVSVQLTKAELDRISSEMSSEEEKLMSIEEIRGATPVSGTKKGGDKEKKINKWKKKKNMATVKEGTKTKVSEKMHQIEEMNDSSKSKTKRAPPKLNVTFFDKTSASKGLSEGEDKNLSTEEQAQSKKGPYLAQV